jgi:hypothetical protein
VAHVIGAGDFGKHLSWFPASKGLPALKASLLLPLHEGAHCIPIRATFAAGNGVAPVTASPFGDANTSWTRQRWRSVVFARLSIRARTARSIAGRDTA